MLTDEQLDRLFEEYKAMPEEDRRTYVNFLAASADWLKIGDYMLFSDNRSYDEDGFLEELPPKWKEKMAEAEHEASKRGALEMLESECDQTIKSACEHVVNDCFFGAHLDEATKVKILTALMSELYEQEKKTSTGELKIEVNVGDSLDVKMSNKWKTRDAEYACLLRYKIWFQQDELRVEKVTEK